jgi:hypothetical protein
MYIFRKILDRKIVRIKITYRSRAIRLYAGARDPSAEWLLMHSAEHIVLLDPVNMNIIRTVEVSPVQPKFFHLSHISPLFILVPILPLHSSL